MKLSIVISTTINKEATDLISIFIGDFEIDTVIGRHHVGALVTVIDRKSKFTLIKKLSSKKDEEATKALMTMLTPLKLITKTITSDNGKEFAYHKEASEALDTSFYFAHPYSSWERELNEHTNGLIRQYLFHSMLWIVLWCGEYVGRTRIVKWFKYSQVMLYWDLVWIV